MGILQIAVLLGAAVTLVVLIPGAIHIAGLVIIYRKWKFPGLLASLGVYLTLLALFWSVGALKEGFFLISGVIIVVLLSWLLIRLTKSLFQDLVWFYNDWTNRSRGGDKVQALPPVPSAKSREREAQAAAAQAPPTPRRATGPATDPAEALLHAWKSDVNDAAPPSGQVSDAFRGKHVHTSNQLDVTELEKPFQVSIWAPGSATPAAEAFDDLAQMRRRFRQLPPFTKIWIRNTDQQTAHGTKINEQGEQVVAEPWEFVHCGWHPIPERHPVTKEARREETGGLDQF